jgi:ubiquinone/menaquinone biosynthesis C-methylase UbiE
VAAEALIESFWNTHPCGENLLAREYADYDTYFTQYDAMRYAIERHIPRCLDGLDLSNRSVLEIGLGQGADSEQLIRRGARWSGLDLTQESVDRVRTRMTVRKLPHEDLVKASVLDIPFDDARFDLVYSHGVLHHVPDIRRAQREISRVLRPGGELVVMLYAKHSLNYVVSISVLRRLGLLAMALAGAKGSGIYAAHLKQAHGVGLRRYLAITEFVHHNTDGPENPYSKVYSARDVRNDFPDFRISHMHKEFMHAPPLRVHALPGAGWLGWHLWVHLVKR